MVIQEISFLLILDSSCGFEDLWMHKIPTVDFLKLTYGLAQAWSPDRPNTVPQL